MKRVSYLLFTFAVMALLGVPAVQAQKGPKSINTGRSQTSGRSAEVRTANADRKAERKTDVSRSESRGKEAQISDDNKLAQKLERNPRLAERLQQMLPAGMTMQEASSGFKNQGQFIAALHTSKNLNIPFDQLKTRMTGEDRMSLGEAIQELRPEMTEDMAKVETKKAELQAKSTEGGE
jgi:hypothetical protein